MMMRAPTRSSDQDDSVLDGWSTGKRDQMRNQLPRLDDTLDGEGLTQIPI